MTATNEIKNLGYANGWLKVPEIVRACQDKNHKRIIKTVARCETQYTCKECNYTYFIDKR